MATNKWNVGDKVAVRIKPEIRGTISSSLPSAANHNSELLYLVKFDQASTYADQMYPADALITIKVADELVAEIKKKT